MASSVAVFDKDTGWNAIMRSMTGSGPDTLSAYVGPDPDAITSDTITHRAKYQKVVTGIDPSKGEFTVRKELVRAGRKEVVKNQRDYYPIYVEYGTRKMAARPFIRFTLDAHDNYSSELRALAERVFRRAQDGDVFMSAAASLRGLANAVAKDIQRTIQGLGAIDTARMYHSVKCLRVVAGNGRNEGGQLVESMSFGGGQ